VKEERRWLIAALDAVPSCHFLSLGHPPLFPTVLNLVLLMVLNVHKSLGNLLSYKSICVSDSAVLQVVHASNR